MGGFVIKDKAEVNLGVKDMYKRFPKLFTRRNQLSFTLSGGEQQLLSIARGLIQKPQILLLDEPSLGLSPKAMQDIFKEIQSIAKNGISVIIVEQNAKAAVKISDRTYVLENGRVAFTGGKEIIKDKTQV